MERRASSVVHSVLLQDTDECSVEHRPGDAGEFGAVVQWRLSHRQALWAGLWRKAGWGVQGGPATEGRGWNAWNGRLTVARSVWSREVRRIVEDSKSCWWKCEVYMCKLMKASMKVFGLFWFTALPLAVTAHLHKVELCRIISSLYCLFHQ